MSDRQITAAPHGHLLTNAATWTPDSRWLVFDTRSAVDGAVFDGTRIVRVLVATGRVETLYESRHGASCGVVTASPVDDRVAFILGPERPDADWRYGPARRQGVVVDASRPGIAEPLDARDLVPPFTPGALRGGTHVHVWSPDGALVSSTYEDAVLDEATGGPCGPRWPARHTNLRGVAVSVCGRAVRVPAAHPRNHDGSAFTVLTTDLADAPRPGGDEIVRACEEAWIGARGYLRADGTRQRRALAFQGSVVAAGGRTITEVFVLDLPDDPRALEVPGRGPLAGTATTRPAPPRGVVQRRITFTHDRSHPGLQGPRHWLRSSPDGSRIACLMRDDRGIVQLFAVSPLGGEPEQLSHDPWDVSSAFTWSPDGGRIAYVADASVMTIDVATGETRRLTHPTPGATAPRPEACVFSPDGTKIAYLRTLPTAAGDFNQIFVVDAR
ncbi:MAG: DUF3748 domain-containing protein [Planctomycetaceae bacterium]